MEPKGFSIVIIRKTYFEGSVQMGYFERVKEIQQLQWQLFMDYWYLHIAVILLGLAAVAFWVLKK
jgi:hypothetical protein